MHQRTRRSTCMLSSLLASVLLLVAGTCVAALANMDKPEVPNASSAVVEWNDFSTNGLTPTEEQIRLHKAAASTEEVTTCVSRLRRVINPAHLPDQLSANILPLSAWTVKLTNTIPPVSKRGNVFLVRYQEADYIVQLTEGLGSITVEIRKADGSQMASKKGAFPEFAIQSAKEWLSAKAQPQDGKIIFDSHSDDEVSRQRGFAGYEIVPLVVVWETRDTPDKNKMKWNMCYAFTDGTTLRYELRCHIDGMMRLTDTLTPRPYMFGQRPVGY